MSWPSQTRELHDSSLYLTCQHYRVAAVLPCYAVYAAALNAFCATNHREQATRKTSHLMNLLRGGSLSKLLSIRSWLRIGCMLICARVPAGQHPSVTVPRRISLMFRRYNEMLLLSMLHCTSRRLLAVHYHVSIGCHSNLRARTHHLNRRY